MAVLKIKHVLYYLTFLQHRCTDKQCDVGRCSTIVICQSRLAVYGFILHFHFKSQDIVIQYHRRYYRTHHVGG